MIEETMKEYYEATGEMPPVTMCLGNAYEEEYEKLLKKAIERGVPYDENDFGEFFKDKPFDLVEKGEALEKNIKKGLK